MFQRFIHRPVLSIVLSLTIIFMGVLTINRLPVSQFPNVAPPQVVVRASFPGASAELLVKSVLIPLEQAINGVQGMRYMTSDATSAGEANIQVFFNLGTDPNIAAVNVQNRLSQVLNQLPPLVQREGVRVMRVQPQMLMYVNLYSTDKDSDMKYLFNFANVNILPELRRITGIGRGEILGSRQYAMRIWLKPDRMRAYNIGAEEILERMSEQSVVGSLGRLGRASGKRSQSLEYVLVYGGRYNQPSQYEEILLRANPEGETLRLRDVADIELGSEYYDIYSNLDEHPSAAIVLNQSYGSNATAVIEEVKANLEELKGSIFPPGMDYEISYDVSTFLNESIDKVLHTLFEAFFLVALVVFVFLGDWRSTLIPTLAVPVSLIGAFFFMQLFGLNINLVTLFALVLAIGIVVDDAIVVVEAVHAKLEEHEHLSIYRAVQLVLGEISGAIIAITLLMAAVFVPVTFMTGPVGVFYRQFSITMASAIILSGVVALTLTPVLCAIILRRHDEEKKKYGVLSLALARFNRAFDFGTERYIAFLGLVAHRKWMNIGFILLFLGGIGVITRFMPAGFIPAEDQGILYAIIQTPPGSTLEHTNEVARELQAITEEIDGIQSVSSLAGYEVLTQGRGSNAGTCLINLKPWSERELSAEEIIEELEHHTRDFGAIIEFFQPPAVPGYGAAGGFALSLLDKTTTGDYQALEKVNDEFMAALRKRKELRGLFTFFTADYPQYEIFIDIRAAMQKGVSIGKAMETLSTLIGSNYELGFIRFNQFYKVFVQAAPEYRRLPDDLLQLYVKNDRDEMVPFSSFITMKKRQGLNEITRYNMFTSSSIRGAPAPGYSSGDAINAVKEVAEKVLPKGYDIDWAGLSFDEVRRGNEALYIFIVVVVFVYLVLAAQYESFLIPFAVVFSLPIGVFGSLALIKLMGLSNDIYAQVGLVMLVGLLGKNAVLIVEFAVQKQQQGATILEAAIEGARVRFRPILMTSFAFIAGLIPLVLASGPGAIGNRTIGASALGGMFLGTVFGVAVVPGLYYIFASLSEGKELIRDQHEWPLTEQQEEKENV
ncbi:efflux RND transporter permease subunit [bacterium]|nr:efflux RND transporter permease subunit [bacterium]